MADLQWLHFIVSNNKIGCYFYVVGKATSEYQAMQSLLFMQSLPMLLMQHLLLYQLLQPLILLSVPMLMLLLFRLELLLLFLSSLQTNQSIRNQCHVWSRRIYKNYNLFPNLQVCKKTILDDHRMSCSVTNKQRRGVRVHRFTERRKIMTI